MIITILSILFHIINLITIFYMIFKEKRTANSIIVWTVILTILPYIGFILFLMIGRKVNNSNIYKLKKAEMEVFENYEKKTKNNIEIDNTLQNLNNLEIMRAIENMEYSPYRENVEVEIFFDGKELFNDVLENLKKAKKSINIQFYIFKIDGIGSQILNVLKEKAKEGVEVRFLYDSVGSRSLTKKKIKTIN